MFDDDDEAAVEALDKLLRDAVSRQMAADVPLGAFLSGGVDSSTIVALMQAQASRPVKTFTIGFNETSYNEAVRARAVAQHLGTEHTELYVTPKHALDVIPLLPAIYDEPFSDCSQIPTVLVSQLTRRHVTVSLSGDGGDELFGGYNHYGLAASIWKRIGWLPGAVRRGVARCIAAVDPGLWNILLGAHSPFTPRPLQVPHPGDKILRGAQIVGHSSAQAFYRNLISHWKQPCNIVIGGSEPPTLLSNSTPWPKTFEEYMMYVDAGSYLPGDILVKVDRAAMAVALETRVPFLDHRVVEFVWRLPFSMKIRNGQTKWLLRQLLYRYVPKPLIERPKMGFGVPIGSWLRGPLREWAESLLDENLLAREGFFHPAPIREKWLEHISARCSWHDCLWDVLMFQQWLENC
jgi:asparagine synthase (glutamine-hydrolysing)